MSRDAQGRNSHESGDPSAATESRVYRVTHGRHCTCSACAREDWTQITSPCGMHGEGCPAVYDPITPDRCHVYMIAATEIAHDRPTGACHICKLPLREHEKRVSSLAPPGTVHIIDEAMLRV